MAIGSVDVSGRTLCFALDLADDAELIAQYRQWHRPGGPPQAVNESIRRAGVQELEIWLTGNRLFMVMDVESDFDPKAKAAADAADPQVRAWEAAMCRFQRALPWAEPGEKWVPAERIYQLSQQP